MHSSNRSLEGGVIAEYIKELFCCTNGFLSQSVSKSVVFSLQWLYPGYIPDHVEPVRANHSPLSVTLFPVIGALESEEKKKRKRQARVARVASGPARRARSATRLTRGACRDSSGFGTGSRPGVGRDTQGNDKQKRWVAVDWLFYIVYKTCRSVFIYQNVRTLSWK